jgi:murein DD-endopeptidase MepM/ murein hydrolase activator NlpD
MANLSELISQRRKSSQSRTGALFGSLKDKLKENIDPRQLINQSGLLTALFPSLKTYKAGGNKQPLSSTVVTNDTRTIQPTQNNIQVKNIEKNTGLFAKNSLYLPDIAREINVSRNNIAKLTKFITGSAPSKADMYFSKSAEMEKMYESKINKDSESKKVSKVAVKGKRKSSFSWIKMFGLIGTVGVSYLLLDFLKNKETSLVKEISDELGEKFDSFKTSFTEFSEKTFTSFSDEGKELFSKLEDSTGKLIDDLSGIFSLDSITDLVLENKGPLTKFETAIADFKQKLSDNLEQFSPISSAAAATLPSSYPSGGLPGASPYGVSEKENQAVRFFEGRGWTREQSIGIVANLIQESNLDPAAFNKKENAQGIAQWRASRLDDFEKRYGKSVRESSLEEQLDFIDYELKQGAPIERKAGDALRKTKTVQEATQVVDKMYERSAGTELNARIRNAERLTASYGTPQTNVASNGPFRISSGYGMRNHPLGLRGRDMHRAVDIAAPEGTPVYSVAEGSIKHMGVMGGYGKTIIVSHSNNMSTLYAHLSNYAAGLQIGKKVNRGELIGYVGSTGVSTGPHLHFELRKDGNPINPGNEMPMTSLRPTISNQAQVSSGDTMEGLSRIAVTDENTQRTSIVIAERVVHSQQNSPSNDSSAALTSDVDSHKTWFDIQTG